MEFIRRYFHDQGIGMELKQSLDHVLFIVFCIAGTQMEDVCKMHLQLWLLGLNKVDTVHRP